MKRYFLLMTMAISMMFFSVSAHAYIILDGWNFNLSVIDAGYQDATNINNIEVSGFATIEQQVVGGVALGQPFTESGYLQFTDYYKEGAAFTSSFNLPENHVIYGYFDALTGILNPDGSISFDPGSGAIGVYLSTVGALDPVGSTLLYDLEVLAPSGGSNLDFYGGTAASSTIDITTKVTTIYFAGLFTDSLGVELLPEFTFHLANVNSLLNPAYTPNPDNSNIDQFGDGYSIIHVQNAGQYNLAVVPEPATMLLLGLGFLGLAGIGRKKFFKNN